MYALKDLAVLVGKVTVALDKLGSECLKEAEDVRADHDLTVAVAGTDAVYREWAVHCR
jgi:hypothetical protein